MTTLVFILINFALTPFAYLVVLYNKIQCSIYTPADGRSKMKTMIEAIVFLFFGWPYLLLLVPYDTVFHVINLYKKNQISKNKDLIKVPFDRCSI